MTTDFSAFVDLDYSAIPEHLQGGLQRYIERGILPGSFLQSVLTNDLMHAIVRADDDLTIEQLRGIVKWLYNETPTPAWGSLDHVTRWETRGGAKGR